MSLINLKTILKIKQVNIYLKFLTLVSKKKNNGIYFVLYLKRSLV